MVDRSRPARSVLFLHAKLGMRDALVDVFRRIDVPGHALQQAGCLSVEVHVPPDEDGPILVTALWTDRQAYDGWLANPWREYSGNERAPFLAADTPLASSTTSFSPEGMSRRSPRARRA